MLPTLYFCSESVIIWTEMFNNSHFPMILIEEESYDYF